MKRPAFQFYPADWRKDVELRSCSIAARGLWIDLMCLAHECEPYGHLIVNGRPMTAAQIAGQVGLAQSQCAKLLQELIDNGVARKTAEGVVYSKRMVEDEDLRQRRAEGGKAGSEHGVKGAEHGIKGGRPVKGRGVSEPPLEPPSGLPIEPPPSSSSSSSSSSNTPLPPSRGPGANVAGFPPGFAEFWAEYPRKEGKSAAAKAFARLKAGDTLRATMIEALRAQKQAPQWLADGGRFIPHAATWLNGRRWEDEPASVQAEIGDDRDWRSLVARSA